MSESTDLVTWSKPRLVKVSPDSAGMTWAPEAYYDKTKGEYVVFWSSSLYAADDPEHKGGSFHRMLYATTRDFHSFSEPRQWIPGQTDSIIDATVIEHDGTFYRFMKDETATKSCDGSHVFQDRSSTLLNPEYQPIAQCIGQGHFRAGEGPLVIKSNTEDKWYLFIDDFGGKGYVPFETTDLASGKWTPAKNYSLPPRPRHGTILPVTQAEYERLLSAFPNG